MAVAEREVVGQETVQRCREDLEMVLEEGESRDCNHFQALKAGDRFRGQSDEYNRALVVEIAHQINTGQIGVGNKHAIAVSLIRELLHKRLPFEQDEMLVLLKWAATSQCSLFSVTGDLMWQIEHYLASSPMTPEIVEALQAVAAFFEYWSEKQLRRYIRRLREWASPADESAAVIPLAPGDVWSDQVVVDITQMPFDRRKLWSALLIHLQRANGSAPTTKWRNEARTLVAPIGEAELRSRLLTWFPLVDTPNPIPESRRHPLSPPDTLLLIDANADILRGLVWLCAAREDGELARALTSLALSTYRKLPGLGPRCVRVGNGCVWALGNMPGREGIYQLALLQLRVKFGMAQKAIEKALSIAAAREGLPRDEIDEISVPTYGLTEVGLRREELGDFTAELWLSSARSHELRWLAADGKLQKSVPKAVKEQHAAELKELQQAAKDASQMLTAQSSRLDGLYLQRRQWQLEQWQARYLDHPLVGILARRLIWRFTTPTATQDAIWYGDGFVDCRGQAVTLAPDVMVQLWHPLDAPVEDVLAWRAWLQAQQVQQPFKQAHREIYLLTDAERRTETYSNRYAAHILKQHQFNALCAARGWRNKLRMMVDDSYPPASKELPEWGLRAEFWIEGAGDTYYQDTNESGAYLRLVTDQVRFYAIDALQNYAHAGGVGGYGMWGYGMAANLPLALEQIPLLVFSEIMRDVDLFVGVTSIGNDPNWADGGPEARYHAYWHTYAFGELSGSAQTRHAVLETLLPRLKIAARCTLSDRFLIVRGDLRTYKIHLGSGNILMEPNEQYLCIVPGQGVAEAGGTLFLPFEGDRMFAIILSKAFLLVDDTKISDPTIMRQIKR